MYTGQTEVCTKHVDGNGTTDIFGLEESKDYNHLVNRVEDSFSDGNGAHLQWYSTSNQCSKGNEECGRRKFCINDRVERNGRGSVEQILNNEVDLHIEGCEEHGKSDCTQSVFFEKGHEVT